MGFFKDILKFKDLIMIKYRNHLYHVYIEINFHIKNFCLLFILLELSL